MAEEPPQKQIERQTAKIASVKELLSGEYIKQEGWDPNYVLTKKKDKISRINVLGVVVTVPENSQSVFIDDGSGKIEIRSFEETTLFNNITIGDIIQIIGRPREYNGEIYINAEIVKKIENKGWLEYRKKEIMIRDMLMPDTPEIEKTQEAPMEAPAPESAPEKAEEVDEIDEILMKIKELDNGQGCDVQELSESVPNAEKMVENLLLKGEIFEISPGKVKILE